MTRLIRRPVGRRHRAFHADLERGARWVASPLLERGRGFERRFDRAVLDGGPSPSRRAALTHLGDRLIVRCDPRSLRYWLHNWVSDGRRTLRLSDRFTDDGEWTAATAHLDGDDVFREMLDLVAARNEYRDSAAFRQLVARTEKGVATRRNGFPLRSLGDVEAYFERYLRLIGRIETQGYRPRRAVASSDIDRTRRARMERIETEVGVAIAPNGEMLRFVGGRHRTAIAVALDCREIPVLVRLVHVDWVRSLAAERGGRPFAALLDWLRENGLPAAHRS